MNLPSPPDKYDRTDQMKTRTMLERLDRQNHKKGQDTEIAGGARLILSSPDGSRWSVEVDDAGALSAVAL